MRLGVDGSSWELSRSVCHASDGDSRDSGTPVSPPYKIDMFESWSHGVSELEEMARVTLLSPFVVKFVVKPRPLQSSGPQPYQAKLFAIFSSVSGLTWRKCQRLWVAWYRGASAPWGPQLTLGSCFI